MLNRVQKVRVFCSQCGEATDIVPVDPMTDLTRDYVCVECSPPAKSEPDEPSILAPLTKSKKSLARWQEIWDEIQANNGNIPPDIQSVIQAELKKAFSYQKRGKRNAKAKRRKKR